MYRDKMAGPVGPAIPAFKIRERLAFVLGPCCPGRSGVAGTLSMPSRVCRVSVGLLVDVGCCSDADDREQNHATRDSPAAVRIGGYIPVDVVGHGRECSRTLFGPGALFSNPAPFALRKNCIRCATLELVSVSQVLSGPNLGHSAASPHTT